MQPQEKILNLESKKFTSPAPQIKRATQHRSPEHMVGSGRKRGFSSQAPPPPAAPPCDVLSSCGHHSPQVLESLTGRAGKLVKQLAWIPEFQLCFFLIRLFHHFFKKKKIGYTSITSLLFLLSICLLPSSLPSQVKKYTTCCTSVTASTALAN